MVKHTQTSLNVFSYFVGLALKGLNTLVIKIFDLFLIVGAKIPPHIHCPSTLRHIFTNYVDFRAVPRKVSMDLGKLQWLRNYVLRNKTVEINNTLLILRKLMYLERKLFGSVLN